MSASDLYALGHGTDQNSRTWLNLQMLSALFLKVNPVEQRLKQGNSTLFSG